MTPERINELLATCGSIWRQKDLRCEKRLGTI